ncbi:TonB-dependent receptor plug domain-containing protein [Cytophaga aurantiaca]|uniref:TonB-dependent receptor plug domain-containing protein n=1 Tax=Cytophaga aurantiaca TaxID=29530 RepID=UPI00037D698F|nr:TonB-dependent receptor [Cytophaga aurantiaca]
MQALYVLIRGLFICLILILSGNQYLHAQTSTDSTYEADIIHIKGYRYEDFSAGNKSIVIDSTYLKQNPGSLADVLSNQSSVYIKSYGVSSIASISIRGGSASQTQTTMNGMIMNSPTTGQVDYSTIPSFVFTNLRVQYGSQVSLMGSGAIGGSIHLSNDADFVKRKQLSISYQQASFGSMLPILSTRIGDSIQQLYAAVYCKQTTNDIFYFDQGEKKQLNHAKQKQAGMYLDYSRRIKNHTLKYWLWYQQFDKQIPGTIGVPFSDAQQYDRNWKQGLQWMYAKRRTVIQSRVGYQSDKMNYQSDTTNIHSIINSQLIQAELEYRYQLNSNVLLLAGTQAIFQEASSDNFSEPTVHQNKIGFFLSSNIKLFNKKLILVPAIRKDWVNTWIPFTPSLGMDYHLCSAMKFHGLVSYNYRVPSLNDLYWNPGGNASLKPESGWGYEAGAAFEKKIHKLTFFQDVTIYTRIIKDWILWTPSYGIWTPDNIQQVWSRGLESETRLTIPVTNFMIQFRNSFAYTKSTNESDLASTDDRKGKQLIYVPLYKNSFTTAVNFKKINIGLIYNYTSWSFITSDNSDYINPYHLFDTYATFNFNVPKSKSTLSINARINNILNTSYEVVASRPMPLRNYQLTLSYTFN